MSEDRVEAPKKKRRTRRGKRRKKVKPNPDALKTLRSRLARMKDHAQP